MTVVAILEDKMLVETDHTFVLVSGRARTVLKKLSKPYDVKEIGYFCLRAIGLIS